MIYCIDPGTEKSGVILIDDDGTPEFGTGIIMDNDSLVIILRELGVHVVIEKFVARGMPVAQCSIDTVFWSGRFYEAAGTGVTLIPRRDVQMAICGSMRANDSTIRQAIVDQFGGKDEAIGKKKTPGPLYGIKSHVWSALAVGLTYLEQLKEKS